MRKKIYKDRYSHWHSQLAADETYSNYAESKRRNRKNTPRQQTEDFPPAALTETVSKTILKALK